MTLQKITVRVPDLLGAVMAATFLVALKFIMFFLLVLRYLEQFMPTKTTASKITFIFTLLEKVLVYSVLLAFIHEFLCGWNCHCMVFINHAFLAAYGRHAATLVCPWLIMILLRTLRYLWMSP